MMGYSIWQLVDVFIETGELSDALALLNEHLNENPTDNKALGIRAEIHLRLGDLEPALDDFRIIQHPTTDQLILYAVTLKRLGMFGSALDVLMDGFSKQGEGTTPDDARLVDCFADIAIADPNPERLQQALDHLARVEGISAIIRQGEITHLLADYHPAIGYYSEAIDRLSSRISQNPYLSPQASSLLCRRGDCYEAIGDTEFALADYTLAESLMPDDVSISMKRALLLKDDGLMRAIWQKSNPKQRAPLEAITPQYIRDSEV